MTPTERWQRSLTRAALSDPEGRVLAELTEFYAERHRSYHNLQHIVDCLQMLEEHASAEHDTVALELALWFHDAIYKPLKGGNELASAVMADDRLGAMGGEPALRRKVHRLIMATTHDAEPSDADEALMIDCDLSILGRDRDAFERYEAAIRSEYRLVPGPLFRRKRKAILASFLDRTRIFSTEPFHERFEATARGNLAWAIARL